MKTRQGWWILAIALFPPVFGAVMLVEQRLRLIVPVVEAEGLRIELNRAVWLEHEMLDTTAQKGMPASMVPDMPPPGMHRLAVELTAANPTETRVALKDWKLVARSPSGLAFYPSSAVPSTLALKPRQRVVFDTRFDVPESAGEVTLSFEHGSAKAPLFSSRVPKHERRPDAGTSPAWPPSVAQLPPGNPETGLALFEGKLACFSCHGRMDEPGSATVGPHLTELTRAGGSRIPGVSSAQYVYDSLLQPDAFLSPSCAGGRPCESPSAMPFYGDILSPEEMAHLIALLTFETGEANQELEVQRAE